MMGISVSQSSYNKSVIHDTSKPDAIAYQVFCESVAMREILRGYIRSEDNPADLLAKIVTRHKQKHLVLSVLWEIYDGGT